jgi:hypothetical protein
VGLYLSIAGGAAFLGIVAVVSMIVSTERNITSQSV